MAGRKKSKPRKKRKATRAKAKTCFVLMPFGAPHDRYYNNVYAPAVVDAGLEPLRADSLFRSSNIVGDIWRLTKEAVILLADLTGKNPNVFYELGLAHAAGKPVVLVSASVDDVPFDLRHLRVLIYDRDDESWGAKLQERITAAVRETLADMAGAIPLAFLEPSKTKHTRGEGTRSEIDRLWKEIRELRSRGDGYRRVSRFADAPRAIRNPKLLQRLRRHSPPVDLSWANEGVLGVVAGYILRGLKIQAIKFVRDVSGKGLSEAKDIVDRLSILLDKMGASPDVFNSV